jgi:hypothetical protein
MNTTGRFGVSPVVPGSVICTSGGSPGFRAGEESCALRSRAGFVGTPWQAGKVRTAYRCRACAGVPFEELTSKA